MKRLKESNISKERVAHEKRLLSESTVWIGNFV